jgi:hypothetical protein
VGDAVDVHDMSHPDVRLAVEGIDVKRQDDRSGIAVRHRILLVAWVGIKRLKSDESIHVRRSESRSQAIDERISSDGGA